MGSNEPIEPTRYYKGTVGGHFFLEVNISKLKFVDLIICDKVSERIRQMSHDDKWIIVAEKSFILI